MNWLLSLDNEITKWLYIGETAPSWLQYSWYSLAGVFIYLLPVVLLVMLLRNAQDRLVAVKVGFSSLVAWQVISNLLGSWLYDTYGFRNRPFADYGLQELLFEKPQKAFPSDHAAVIAAVTVSFILYRYPKLAWLFGVGGLLALLGRVVLGFHWVGDILGGALIGTAVSLIVFAFDRTENAIWLKLLNLFRKTP